MGGGVLEIGKGEGVNSSSCSKFIEYNVDWILISSNTLLLNIITQNFQPLKKSTNQKKKYSTTSNDTSQRSATHSRRIQIRAARRKKDRCFHYLAGVLHCYNVFLLVSRVCLFQLCLLVENVNKYKVTCHLAHQSLLDGSGERLAEYWCVLAFIVQRTRFKQNSARTIVKQYNWNIRKRFIITLGACPVGHCLTTPPPFSVIILTSDLSGRLISLWHLSLAVKRLSAINEHRVTNSGRRDNSINFRCNYLVIMNKTFV